MSVVFNSPKRVLNNISSSGAFFSFLLYIPRDYLQCGMSRWFILFDCCLIFHCIHRLHTFIYLPSWTFLLFLGFRYWGERTTRNVLGACLLGHMCVIFLRVQSSGFAGWGVKAALGVTFSLISPSITLHFDFSASASLTSCPRTSLQTSALVILPTLESFSFRASHGWLTCPLGLKSNTISPAPLSGPLSLAPHLNESLPSPLLIPIPYILFFS